MLHFGFFTRIGGAVALFKQTAEASLKEGAKREKMQFRLRRKRGSSLFSLPKAVQFFLNLFLKNGEMPG